MDYDRFSKMSVDEKREFMFSQVLTLMESINNLRMGYDASLCVVSCKKSDDNCTTSVKIHCPFATIAWKLAVVLEASSILDVTVEGSDVLVE